MSNRNASSASSELSVRLVQRRLNVRCDQPNSSRTVNASQRHARSRNNKNKNGQLNPDHLHKEVAVRARARNHNR